MVTANKKQKKLTQPFNGLRIKNEQKAEAVWPDGKEYVIGGGTFN